MTTKAETAVREAAAALQTAIVDARAAGLHVAWPRDPGGLGAIAISATAKVKNLDGSEVVRDAKGVVHGDAPKLPAAKK